MLKKRGWGLLASLDSLLAGVCFIILVAITFVGVIMRYFLHNPIVWQEEIQLWLFLWIAFFGGSAAFRHKGHIEIDMVVELLPKTVQKVISVCIYALVVIVLAYLGMKGMTMVIQYAATDKSTFVLSIPGEVIYSVVPISCALMILNYSVVTFRDFFGKNKEEETE